MIYSKARGNYIKFRILTRGTAGSSYYSKYKETSAIRRNSKLNPPTEIKTSLLSYVLGESLTISWWKVEIPLMALMERVDFAC